MKGKDDGQHESREEHDHAEDKEHTLVGCHIHLGEEIKCLFVTRRQANSPQNTLDHTVKGEKKKSCFSNLCLEAEGGHQETDCCCDAQTHHHRLGIIEAI